MRRFDVFGYQVGVTREAGGWRAVFIGQEGKHRPAHFVAIPDDLPEADVKRFLADLFHEAASPQRPDVIELDAEGRPWRG